jgi:alginate O-acetyltransferase complex protein AlgI
MVFSSVGFLFFFLPIILVLYAFFRNKKIARNVLLIAASLFFYFWDEKEYTLVLVGIIIMNYCFGLLLDRTGSHKSRKIIIIISTVLNLLPLVFFKYTGFFIENLNAVRSLIGFLPIKQPAIHFPLGISFFTFQIMSYTIDLYRGKIKTQKNFLSLSLFLTLFPKLGQGPIMRYADFENQIDEHRASLEDYYSGIKRFIIGLGKKVLIANVAAGVSDKIFAVPSADFSAGVAWLGLICFTIQLYFDFSGYTDMAIGLGRMFGFKITENFNYPYAARSIKEFWAKWHISLTSWFRDYLYFPLGGSHVAEFRLYFNIVFVFIITGLWHGASWNFVIWGLWHGGFLVLERILPKNFFEKMWRPFGNAYQMMVVMLSLVMFRSPNFPHAINFIKSLFGFSDGLNQHGLIYYINSEIVIAIIFGIIGSYPIVPFIQNKITRANLSLANSSQLISQRALSIIVTALLFTILILSFMSVASDTYNPFLYGRSY